MRRDARGNFGARVPEREHALSEAADLARVCRPCELSTSEIFEPNAYYGNDWLLKLYTNLPQEKPLKVVVPHGIVFDETYVWEAERRALVPAVLVYSDNRAHAYARSTRKLLIRAAVPFAYLPRLLGEVSPNGRSGTLFFPGHSSHRATAHTDFAGMADCLARMAAKYQPVTVCIYWRDWELGRHLPFLARGLRVVSAGHMFDPAFLFRLYYLCQAHRYAASNHVGSSLLYAALAGCSFSLLPGFSVTYSGAKEHLAKDLSGGSAYLDALVDAFAAPVEKATVRQSALVREICGLDCMLSPEEFRGVLTMADRLDRFGVARYPGRRRVYVAFPRTYLRAGRKLARAARQLVRNLTLRKPPS